METRLIIGTMMMVFFFLLVTGTFHPFLTEGCGRRPGFARVVNGEDAAQHSWPRQISLRVRGRHICGGSLIKPDWIVTAAHCVDRNLSPYNYEVVVGAHSRTGTTSVQRELQVVSLHKHSGFSMQNLKHDIAVLKLKERVPLSDKVNTICLPTEDAPLKSVCYITGCEDNWVACTGNIHFCHLESVYSKCKKTCNKCGLGTPAPSPPGTNPPPPPPPTETNPPPPPPSGCKDSWDLCRQMSHLCSDHSMMTLCKKTCNNC